MYTRLLYLSVYSVSTGIVDERCLLYVSVYSVYTRWVGRISSHGLGSNQDRFSITGKLKADDVDKLDKWYEEIKGKIGQMRWGCKGQIRQMR